MSCSIPTDVVQLICFLTIVFLVIMISKRRTDKWTQKTVAVMCADNVLLCYTHGFPEMAPKFIMGKEADEFMGHLVKNGLEADMSADKEEIFVRKGDLFSVVKVYY